MNSTVPAPSPAPSLTSRVLASLFLAARVKTWAFAPHRYRRPRQPRAVAAPAGLRRTVRVDRCDIDGWPVFVLSPRAGVAAGVGDVLFLHGGAYAEQIGSAQWMFAANLARATGRPVTIPIFPLTPEHAHGEVFPVLRRLYARLVGESASLAVVGESAGAGMALALVQTTDAGIRPRDLVLLSPWLDATMTNPEIPAVEPTDPTLSREHIVALGAAWANPEHPSTPLVSPINGPLAGLNRVTVFTGTRDILNPDARRFAALAAAQGTVVDLRERQGMMHDWMLMPIPEAKRVTAEIAEVLAAD